MRKVAASEVATAIEATERPLPPQFQEALGELVGAARERVCWRSALVSGSGSCTS